jgi:hypothetical protein
MAKDAEELLNEQKREFVRLDLEVKRLKAMGYSEEASERRQRLRELGRAIVAGNQAQDLANLNKPRRPVKYGAPSFTKKAGKKGKSK